MLKLATWYAVWVSNVLYLAALFFGARIVGVDPFFVTGLSFIALATLWRCPRCSYPISLDYLGDKKRGRWGLMLPRLPMGECKRCGCSYLEQDCGHAPDLRD